MHDIRRVQLRPSNCSVVGVVVVVGGGSGGVVSGGNGSGGAGAGGRDIVISDAVARRR